MEVEIGVSCYFFEKLKDNLVQNSSILPILTKINSRAIIGSQVFLQVRIVEQVLRSSCLLIHSLKHHQHVLPKLIFELLRNMTVGDLGTEINPKFEGISAGFEIRAGGEFENNLE